jgi:hypothetical protein
LYPFEGLWRLPVKLLLPTKNAFGGSLDRDEKDVFAVNAKALCWNLTVGAKLPSYHAQVMATFHAQQDGSFALTGICVYEKVVGVKRPTEIESARTGQRPG